MKKKFTKNDGQNAFLLFMLFSFLGVVYEEIIALFKYYHRHHKFLWRVRRGVIYGPFNPLYGWGVVFIWLVIGRKKEKPVKTFIYGALLGGFIEYTTSFLMELVLKVKSWDYSNRFLNINGRTTIPYMIFWGLMITLLIQVIIPYSLKLFDLINKNFKKWLITFLAIFIVFDMGISWTALLRQNLRHKGFKPITVIGEFYDRVYPDEVLKKTYNNMKFVNR